jgi:hypothetical protein
MRTLAGKRFGGGGPNAAAGAGDEREAALKRLGHHLPSSC